jgi:hypothetical protein
MVEGDRVLGLDRNVGAEVLEDRTLEPISVEV